MKKLKLYTKDVMYPVITAVVFLLASYQFPVNAQTSEIAFNRLADSGLSSVTSQTVKLRPKLKLVDRQGNTVSLAKFKGKPVFLNIWATWCGPCRKEMPGISSLYNEMGDQVQFVMLSVDRDFQKAKDYVDRYMMDFPIYRPSGNLPPALRGRGIPRTYLLDKNGNVRSEYMGSTNFDTEEFKSTLRKMIAK